MLPAHCCGAKFSLSISIYIKKAFTSAIWSIGIKPIITARARFWTGTFAATVVLGTSTFYNDIISVGNMTCITSYFTVTFSCK